MRFAALLVKELRESMPWILLATILLLSVGFLTIRFESAYYGPPTWYYSRMVPGNVVEPYDLFHYSVLNAPAIWLLLIAIGLGLVLGGRHFAVPSFTRTWPFLLHRSVSRMTILTAKVVAAATAIIICLGSVWLILYWYASRPGLFLAPPPEQTLIDGCLYIVLGMIVYFGTALSVLSSSRWYTTKSFGLILATIVVFAAIAGSSRPWALVVIIVAAVLLLSQIVDTFLNREF